MAINWSCLNRPANPASKHSEGDVIRNLTDRAIAQAEANQRALQQAIADEKKRQRIEDRKAAAIFGLTPEE